MERVITIKDAVVLKTGISKKGPWTLSAIKDENGDGYTTFKNELRELAEGNLEAQAKVLFTQNGDRVTLDDLQILSEASVSPSNGTGQLNQIQVSDTEPETVEQLRSALSSYSKQIQDLTAERSNGRQTQIMRQTAAKVAAHIEAAHTDPEGFDKDSFYDFCDELVTYFEQGQPIGVPFGE